MSRKRRLRAVLLLTAYAFEALIVLLLRAAPVLLYGAVVTLALTRLPQGREALFAASDSVSRSWAIVVLAPLLGLTTTLAAIALLRPVGSRVHHGARRAVFAWLHVLVPALLGLAASLWLPVWIMLHAENFDAAEAGRAAGIRVLALGIILFSLAVPFARSLWPIRNKFRNTGAAPVFRAAGAGRWAGPIGGFAVISVVASLSLNWLLAGGAILCIGLAGTDACQWRARATTRNAPAVSVLLACVLVPAIWIFLGLWLAWNPVLHASGLGSAASLLVVIGFWLSTAMLLQPVLSLLGRSIATLGYSLKSGIGFLGRRNAPPHEPAHAARMRRSPRWLTVVLVGVVLFIGYRVLTGPYNAAEVRSLPEPPHRVLGWHFDAHWWLGHWLDARLAQQAEGSPIHAIVVTADGGGIRAAVWSALLLSALQDREPAFASRILALSGVSGGSLGVATFSALIADADHLDRCGPDRTKRMESCAERVLGADFLAPAIVAIGLSDLINAGSGRTLLPDRATALEQAFETGWRDTIGTDTFAEPYDQLWAGADRAARVPDLFLNGTEARRGKRVVMGPYRLGADTLSIRQMMPSGELVRLSTAVMMSARFPAVSPIGVVTRDGAPTSLVVDGGFLDNSGTATALEVIAALRSEAARRGVEQRLDIVVLSITNAPEPEPGAVRREMSAAGWGYTSLIGAASAPLATLDLARGALTQAHRDALRADVCANGGRIITLSLREDAVDFPLGWMLSARTRDAMQAQIDAAASDPDSAFSAARAAVRGDNGGRSPRQPECSAETSPAPKRSAAASPARP